MHEFSLDEERNSETGKVVARDESRVKVGRRIKSRRYEETDVGGTGGERRGVERRVEEERKDKG